MAEWTGKKVNKSQLNGGEEYNLDSDVAIEELNAIVNNSLYASESADDARMKASEALQNSQSALADGINPNLLINSDFRVNQKGQTIYDVNTLFTVDAWKLVYGSLAINSDGSVTHTSTYNWQGIRQYITNPSRLAGKTVTFSMRANSTSTRLAQINLTKAGATSSTILGTSNTIQTGEAITSFTATIPSDVTDDDSLFILLYTPQANQSVTYYWTKLEIGSIATAYSPKPYEQELADCQVIEGGIATTYSNPNLLINGDFRVNQRGFTSADIVSNAIKYSFDRWRYYHWGNSAEITENSDGSITIYNTTTTTSSGEGIIYFTQQIEEFISKTFNNKTFTISCKYKLEHPDSSKQGDCYFYFEQSGATTSGTLTGKLAKTTTPVIETRTFTVNGTTTKGSVAFNLRQGAKLTLYWVKLELGSVATAHSPRPYAEELALCQRYYWILNFGFNTTLPYAVARNNTTLSFNFNLPTKLRTYPTLTQSGTIKMLNSPSTTTLPNFVLNNYNDGGVRLFITTTGITEGGAYVFAGENTGYISLDAEIY